VRSFPFLREANGWKGRTFFPILFPPLRKPTSLACHHLPSLKCEKKKRDDSGNMQGVIKVLLREEKGY